MAIGDDVEMENRCEHELQFENRNSQHRHNCVINRFTEIDIMIICIITVFWHLSFVVL